MKKSFYNRREIHSGYRKTQHYPSAAEVGCSTGKTSTTVRYTGSLVKGIATMHKSNAIPVTQGINTNPKMHKGGVDD